MGKVLAMKIMDLVHEETVKMKDENRDFPQGMAEIITDVSFVFAACLSGAIYTANEEDGSYSPEKAKLKIKGATDHLKDMTINMYEKTSARMKSKKKEEGKDEGGFNFTPRIDLN
jgi:hypothetical protein